jgi:hypothetical protein
MIKHLEVLNKLDVEVDRFYSITIDIREISLQAHYSSELAGIIMDRFKDVESSVCESGYITLKCVNDFTRIRIILT